MTAPSERGFLVPVADDDQSDEPIAYGVTSAARAGLTHEQEKQILIDDLAADGVDLDTATNVEGFIQRLKKGKVLLDEDVVRAVLTSVSGATTTEASITGRKFADAFVLRLREHRDTLDAAHRELHTIERLLHSSEAALRKENAREAFLTGGPAAASAEGEDSKLTVQIVSIQHLQHPVEEGTAFKIHLECQNQAIETKTQVYRQGDVFWNEMFSFQIESPDGDLRLTLLKVGFQQSNCGDASIILEDLADQKKHEMSREIWGALNCEVFLSCQWVYAKKQLYNTYVREFTAKRENKHREINQFQIEQDKFERALAGSHSAGGAGLSSFNGLGGLLHGQEFLSQAVDRAMENMKLSSYQVASQYAVAISLLLCSVASYARPLFVDLQIMGFAYWCNLDPKRWSARRYEFLLGAILLSEILDLTWMATYFSAWNNATVEADMQNITKIFSIFNFLWKIIMFLFFWKCYYDLKKKNQRRGVAVGRQRAATAQSHNHQNRSAPRRV